MKKLLFLAVLLSLTGCGETDQNNTSQASLQSSPASVNYRMAASPSAMSAPVASFGQWVVNGYTTEGASTVLNANRTIGGVATEAKALITPNVSQVSKILRKGLGGFALTFAVDELLDGIDWVMDPANNRVIYREPTTYPSGIYSTLFSSGKEPIEVCKFAASQLGKTYKSFQVIGVDFYCQWTDSQHWVGNFQPTPPEEKTLPLDVVSQKIIDNAESGNTDAQAVTLAAAQAIVSEAENDAEKAKPIEDELEKNSKKCPDGRLRNYYGQCFICGSADLEQRMKIDIDIAKGAHESLGACKATHTIEGLTLRYNNYVNEAVARDKLNACYDIPHQPHLNQAKEAWRQAQEVCVKYMAAK